jgi:hypothetical protein
MCPFGLLEFLLEEERLAVIGSMKNSPTACSARQSLLNVEQKRFQLQFHANSDGTHVSRFRAWSIVIKFKTKI